VGIGGLGGNPLQPKNREQGWLPPLLLINRKESALGSIENRIKNFCAAHSLNRAQFIDQALANSPGLPYPIAITIEMETIMHQDDEDDEPEPPRSWWFKTLNGGV
jgi:hypothetical protein